MTDRDLVTMHSFDDLVTMVVEALDGIKEEQLLAILPILFPGVKVHASGTEAGTDYDYEVEWP